MTDQEDKNTLGKIVFDNNNQERKAWACLEQTCSRLLIVFLSQHFVILLILFGCFWRIHRSKTCEESIVWGGNLCSAAGYILPSPRLEHVNFYKKSSNISLVDPSETRKSQLICNWLKIVLFQPKSDKIYFFLSTFPTSLQCYAKGN